MESAIGSVPFSWWEMMIFLLINTISFGRSIRAFIMRQNLQNTWMLQNVFKKCISSQLPFFPLYYCCMSSLWALSYTHPPSHWKCNAILLNQPIRNARIFEARAELDNRIGQSRKIRGRAWPFQTTLPSKHWLNSVFIISYQGSESRAVSYHIYDLRNYI